MNQDILSTLAAFCADLLVDCNGVPRPYAEVLDDWQRADLERLGPGWQRAAGQGNATACQRAYLERPRGHSKTTDLAVMVLYALLASRRRILGLAGDMDQARLLLHAADQIVRLNPWLAEVIEVQRNQIINLRTGSRLEVLASDAPTSYGLTPDFIVCDEITHWKSRDLWDSLLGAAAKRQHCMMVIIANAGLGMAPVGSGNFERHAAGFITLVFLAPRWTTHELDYSRQPR